MLSASSGKAGFHRYTLLDEVKYAKESGDVGGTEHFSKDIYGNSWTLGDAERGLYQHVSMFSSTTNARGVHEYIASEDNDSIRSMVQAVLTLPDTYDGDAEDALALMVVHWVSEGGEELTPRPDEQ